MGMGRSSGRVRSREGMIQKKKLNFVQTHAPPLEFPSLCPRLAILDGFTDSSIDTMELENVNAVWGRWQSLRI